MTRHIVFFALFCALFCASLFAVGCGSVNVKTISLRDNRLPIEARRWLADSEDEVAIATARVDDKSFRLYRLERYQDRMLKRVANDWNKGKAGAAESGKKAIASWKKLLGARLEFAKLEVTGAIRGLTLARLRLDQARAETAIRYDLAVYEIEKISRAVEAAREDVATTQHEIEKRRELVEKAQDEMWVNYRSFVMAGGVSAPLWRDI